jgi:methionyl-tRNA formyltransferase
MVIFLGNAHSIELYKDFIEQHKRCTPDIVVSCQYPHKIPESLINSHICVNVHYGLLPQYAGCNPVYWQVLQEDQIGATLHYVDRDWDSGDIIATATMPCGNLTADLAYDALAIAGLNMLERHWDGILNGTAPRQKQDLSNRKYYKKTDVNFAKECKLGKFFMDDRKVRALHFAGKQYPTIEVGGLKYELRRVSE